MTYKINHQSVAVQAAVNINFLQMMEARERETLELFKSQLYYWENHGIKRLSAQVIIQYRRIESLMNAQNENHEKIIAELSECEELGRAA